MMRIGYARVSTQDQTLQLQHDALTDGGCEKLSGTRTTLPAKERNSSRSRARAMSSWCGNSIALGAPSAI